MGTRQRIKEIASRRKKASSEKINVKSRLKILQNLEGWYNFSRIGLQLIIQEYPEIESMKDWKDTISNGYTPRGTKMGKALRRFGFSPSQISHIYKLRGVSQENCSFKLSCRYNDLLRADKMQTFTCFKKWRGTQMLHHLADRDVCIIFLPDKSGKYQARCWARIVRYNNRPALALYKMYGYGFSHQHIAEALKGKIHVMKLDIASNKLFNSTSFSKILVSALNKPIWIDHSYSFDPSIHKMRYKVSKI